MERVRKSLFCLFLLLAVFLVKENRGLNAAEFESFFGGLWSDGARSLVPLSDGGFALAGWKAVEGQPETTEGWIVRVDDRGRYRWDLPLSGTGPDGVLALSPALDGGLLAISEDGDTESSNSRLTKISPEGTIEWAKTYGARGRDRVAALHPTFDGGVIMAGNTTSNAAGNTDGWIIKLNREFDVQWFRILGGLDSDGFTDVTVTQEGAFIVVGWITNPEGKRLGWSMKINRLGATVWQNVHDLGQDTIFECVLAPDDHGPVFVANVMPLNSSNQKIIIGGLDADGTRIWEKVISATGSTMANDLMQRSDGLLIAAASVEDESGKGGLVIEFTQDGSFETIRRYGGPRANQALAISHAGLDSYAVAGTSTDPEKDNQDMWLVIGRELLQIPLSPQGSAP